MENSGKISGAIKNWAPDDRPREKLLTKGATALSDSELIAILIGNGHQKSTALDLGKAVLQLGQNNLMELGKLSISSLLQIRGIGEAKAVIITAALELGRRRQAAIPLERTVVRSSQDIAGVLKSRLQDLRHEAFAVAFLNQANKIIRIELISQGGITGTVADPRLILKRALELEATSLVLCHNHPSGNLRPSRADEELTRKIREGALLIDIRVLDHLIVTEEGYFSFMDEGLL